MITSNFLCLLTISVDSRNRRKSQLSDNLEWSNLISCLEICSLWLIFIQFLRSIYQPNNVAIDNYEVILLLMSIIYVLLSSVSQTNEKTTYWNTETMQVTKSAQACSIAQLIYTRRQLIAHLFQLINCVFAHLFQLYIKLINWLFWKKQHLKCLFDHESDFQISTVYINILQTEKEIDDGWMNEWMNEWMRCDVMWCDVMWCDVMWSFCLRHPMVDFGLILDQKRIH